jgi:protein-S-isoprenylcysteine O-methyltransferase Ste14
LPAARGAGAPGSIDDMPEAPLAAIAALWLCWAAFWTVAAIGVKASARREPMRSRLLHLVPLAVAALLLWGPSAGPHWLQGRVLATARWPLWTGAALVAAGLLFTVWARLHLGRNWSGIVTLKHDHELVTSGPYAIVRHPIYSGLLLAFVGSAIANGEWRGVLAVIVAAAALWRKLRLEERWMGERFGVAYEQYQRRVAALVPFVV